MRFIFIVGVLTALLVSPFSAFAETKPVKKALVVPAKVVKVLPKSKVPIKKPVVVKKVVQKPVVVPTKKAPQSQKRVAPILAPVVVELPKPQTHTVTYTDNGFSPATLDITTGESVTFVNNSSDRMWVASNPHPTHQTFSDFDERTGVRAGGTYTFTFSQKGTWAYHNHLNPGMRGVVIAK